MSNKSGGLSRAVCSAALMMSGCSSTASVGKDSCIGDAIVCATDVEVREFVLRSDNWPDGIATVGVATIAPKAFYRPAALPKARAILAPGPDQTVWSATMEDGSVLLERISREGELIESRHVPAPAKTYSEPGMPGLQFLPAITLEIDAKQRPLLWLHYVTLDAGSSDQLFLFQETLDEAPARLGVEKLHPADFMLGVARTASGGVLIRGARPSDDATTWDGFVEERDAQAKIVWRQTALENDLIYSEREGIVTPITSLAAGGSTTARLDGFLDLDQDGNAVDAGRFVGPSLVAFQKILVAKDGRRIVAGPTSGEFGLGGDLAIVRLSSDSTTSADSWLVARQGYTNLSASALSTDARGDVLVATAWGKRLSLWEHRLICRLSHGHERDACFEIAEPAAGEVVATPISSLVSLEPGVIIVASREGLDRIELP